MVFKSFRLLLIARVLLLSVMMFVSIWCFVNGFMLRSVYGAGLAIILLIELIWFIDRFNRDIKTFLISLQQRDFTTRFQIQNRWGSFNELYAVLNRISDAFRSISREKEVQHRYLEMLFEHVRVGILSIDETNRIRYVNQALKDLLQVQVITSLHTLDGPLAETVQTIRTNETRLVKVSVRTGVLHLSIHASEFKLEDTYYKLISLQNIRTELEVQEVESWQKLIRVLSHEIMNSVAPVTSLSATLHGLVIQERALQQNHEPLYEALDKGLEAIRTRSEGLYDFTQTYRKMATISKASRQPTDTRALIGHVEALLRPQLDKHRIQFTINAQATIAHLDAALMEQVLINLLLNAMDAVSATPVPVISLACFEQQQKICFHIQDNGAGIDADALEKIFIPFYTTKQQGSGVGLAITRQIVQLHGGEVQVYSKPGEGAIFLIVLPQPPNNQG
jgi:nitrogen fixation/metabolism regulation signal transduction histidine kinase